MARRFRKEPDIQYTVTVDNVKDAVCQDPHLCSHAQALAPVLAARYGAKAAETVRVDIGYPADLADDDFTVVAWDGDDGRHYTAEGPGNISRHLLMLTDHLKVSLLKMMKRDHREGLSLTLTNVESRSKQVSSKPRDTTTLQHARYKGYWHGRSPNAAAKQDEFLRSGEYRKFTPEQRVQYAEGLQLGSVKGQKPKSKKRKPRISGKGRIGVLPDAQ